MARLRPHTCNHMAMHRTRLTFRQIVGSSTLHDTHDSCHPTDVTLHCMWYRIGSEARPLLTWHAVRCGGTCARHAICHVWLTFAHHPSGVSTHLSAHISQVDLSALHLMQPPSPVKPRVSSMGRHSAAAANVMPARRRTAFRHRAAEQERKLHTGHLYAT